MSEEQLKAFLEKVKGDTDLQERLQLSKSSEEIVGIAKEHGHELTQDHWSQLSEEELESLNGGTLGKMIVEGAILGNEIFEGKNKS